MPITAIMHVTRRGVQPTTDEEIAMMHTIDTARKTMIDDLRIMVRDTQVPNAATRRLMAITDADLGSGE